MRESEVPVEQRYLIVHGIVHGAVYKKVRGGLSGEEADGHTLCLFLSYAYADIPVGREFGRVFARANILEAARARCVVKSATQQFAAPLEYLPHGWKTICLVGFPAGVPELFGRLPVVRGWFESEPDTHLCMSDEETWDELKAAGRVSLLTPGGK
jgi:hypothetical protein